ncbi:MAG: outer membrane protein assembly factor BamA [Elusimicrobiota bacterium]|jgi:outer membrane protein insertion porin family|nr:outer membrane protein assembly factor BamA [Elusimicrobiota bacterium]
MKKYLAIAFLLLFSSMASAQTDVISRVEVLGLKNVKEKDVLSAIVSKKQHIYTEETVRDDARAILELGYFEDLEYKFNPRDGVLTFTVAEKPYIEKMDFKGNKQISRGKLRRESSLKEKQFFDSAKLEETKLKIFELYADEGYSGIELEVYPITDDKTNKMSINFLITENNKITIAKIEINGLKSFNNRTIIRQMKNTRIKKPFKPEGFRTDLKTIETFYVNNGFMDYSFIGSSITYNDERTLMTITLDIDEGPRYKIGGITASGYEALQEKTIKDAFKLRKGRIFKQDELIETMQGLYESYSDIGYLNANINPEFKKDAENGIVDINFAILENTRVYVGNIYIDGLYSTKDKVIRREISLKNGDPLSASKVRLSMQKIYNLGFIEGVEPKLIPVSQDTMDLEFNVTEGRPGMISAGAGYSSVDSFVASLQFQYLNLFGLGQRVNLLGEFGQIRQNYQIDWTEPWIFGQNAALTLSLYNVDRIRDYAGYSSVYDEKRIGSSVRIAPRLSDTFSVSLGYSFENVNIRLRDGADGRAVALFNAATDISKDNISSILASIAYDTRDYYFDPSKGQRESLSFQVASKYLGGDRDFIKTRFRSSWFFPTFWKFVLSFNLNLGEVEGYNGQDVPINEYYYIGGVDTVRGYKYNTNIGNTGGARYMAVFNVEYKFPIYAEKNRTILQGAFFYDIGGSWKYLSDVDLTLATRDPDSENPSNKDRLRHGVGFGIRFATPMFPLRLDWGYGLNRSRDDARTSEFYFTIGSMF